ncbi:helix-turn-helix domain-containing protein [Candidatus Paracaedibacter symbiosus]|uniref:helix-turn-helix domain-containing protein n=1 Tax=Candidatus Paracaedibacter symbiosus TaxID=244582 RepID=UPI00068BF853|nr:helix-turn-helix transcriptional regulator [Candidatus Paracaedibacter symbiosus]
MKSLLPNKKSCTAKDLYIAKKIRERRIEKEIKQHELAKALGVTPQQIFKYEKGIDRVSASRLQEISKILSVPINFFYQNAEEDYFFLEEIIVKVEVDPKFRQFSSKNKL